MSNPAFDPVAAGYDEQFTHSAVGRLQRALVHKVLDPKIRPGGSVLELNCGTGEDALWLAQRGCSVLATDLSAEMLAVTAAKAEQAGLQQLIQTRQLDLRALQADSQFDLILSNFGGLNCLTHSELSAFGKTLPQLLQPDGQFVAVVMGRFCAWESLYFFLKGQARQARRRWNGGPVQAQLDVHTRVPTWYFGPAEFSSFFPELSVRSVQPIGCWLPPSYLNPWFSRRPWLLRSLNFMEKRCRGSWWAAAADHFVVIMGRASDGLT